MNVFIVGGTTGVGYSLALYYLSKGNDVAVCGRNIKRIADSSPENLKAFKVNVSNKEELEKSVQSFLNENDNIDLFINCAGSYADDVTKNITFSEAKQMLDINISGTVNFFEIACDTMISQKLGSIAVIASVSGILDHENSSLYSKTKRVVIQIANAYYHALKPFGISVTTIIPGYIDTSKLRALNNEDLSKKIFLIDLDTATSIIVKAIEDRKREIIFPSKMKWLMVSLSILPSSFLDLIMYKKAKWMNKK